VRKPLAYKAGAVQCAECFGVLYLEVPPNRSIAEITAKCGTRDCKNFGIEVLVKMEPVYAR
jgi:hypothetical protein